MGDRDRVIGRFAGPFKKYRPRPCRAWRLLRRRPKDRNLRRLARMTRHIFIGYDAREAAAYKVAERSIMFHAKADMDFAIHPVRDWDLRKSGLYWRGYRVDEKGQMYDDRDGKPFSTQFAFTRFCVPELARRMDIHEPVLFMDCDVMLRADVSELFDLWDDSCSVMCVHHNL